jgi:DNA-binding response OmpR family regulator
MAASVESQGEQAMAKQTRTLVVDDEAGIRFFLEQALQQVGHSVVTASSGEEALHKLRDTPFDLIMLDLMLGGRVDGMRVLQTVKWRWPATVVIILTAHGSLDSSLAAIREGVDGYLLKPVEPEELWQAVEGALGRRSRMTQIQEQLEHEKEEEQILRGGPFTVDMQKAMATLSGQLLDLNASEFALLAHLMENAYRAVPPPELVKAVRGYECDDLDEARQIIKWYVHSLRQKVEPDPSQPRHILTVRGVGYRFVE